MERWMQKSFTLAARASAWYSRLVAMETVQMVGRLVREFVLTALLARGVILGGWSPFGVAMTAAAVSQNSGYAAVMGAFVGSLLPETNLMGLTTAAAALMTLICGHVFEPWRERKVWLMPLLTAVCMASCTVVCLNQFTITLLAQWLFASVLAGLAVLGYRMALAPVESLRELQQPIGGLVVLTTLAMSLSDLTMAGVFSPARVIALFVVICIAYLYGDTTGTAVGVGMGACLDLAAGGAYFTCTYGITALVAGAFQGMRKRTFALVALVAGLSSSLLGAGNPFFLANVVETIGALLIFAGVPQQTLDRLHDWIFPDKPDPQVGLTRLKQRMGRYTAEASQAFHTLYLSMLSGAEYGKADKNAELRAVFDRAGQEICNRCPACHSCWQRDTLTAISAFREASVPMLRRGYAIGEDFPLPFRNRCAHFPELLRTVNDGLHGLQEREAFRQLCAQNRSLVARQYAGITDILKQMSGTAPHDLTALPHRERQVRAYVSAFGRLDNVAVYRDGHTRIRVELTGQEIGKIMQQKQGFTAGLSALLHCGLTEPEMIVDELGERLLLREQAPFRVVVSISQRKKEGESVSGDSGRWFVTEEGVACMLLADGMGTGEHAARDSRTLLGLMERFLRAGIAMEDAVCTIAPAFLMRADGMRGVTLDVLTVDLFTGVAHCLKCGAAPAYYCTNGCDQTAVFSNRTLPLGLTDRAEQAIPLMLQHGDVFAMVTDGVSDGQEDGWVKRLLHERRADSPKELAARLVMNAAARGSQDDLTAMVIRMEKRAFLLEENAS